MDGPRKLNAVLPALTLAICLVAGPVGLLAPAAMLAQGAIQRTVQGKVLDKQDAGIKGAVVYLKDSHSLQVKSFFSGEDGSYRFGQLAQNVDYEVWAEDNGKKSPVKTISSFNSRNEINLNLKIDAGK